MNLRKRLDAAQGRLECDLILKNVQFLDVFSCEWRSGDLAIYDGVIVGLNPGLKSKRELNLRGKKVVPGFIDAHVHVESSMMIPKYFQETVLLKGTTTAICDPHELANVIGIKGIQYFLDSSQNLSLDLFIMLSSCVPSTNMETNGAGEILAEELVGLSQHPRVLGLAEMMNVPGVLNGEPKVLAKLNAFSHKIMDGHCPLLTGEALSAYASTGISSCHESSELTEAREKLAHGISIWIREGSVAKDLNALFPLLNLATSTSIGFCTDDRNPLDISEEGHIDHIVRSVIHHGIPNEIVYRSASWSVARHYGLDRGPNRLGAIAPGFQADLVILDDSATCSIHEVLKKGTLTKAIESPLDPPLPFENSIRAQVPESHDLEGPAGLVHTIGVIEGKIITDHRIRKSTDPGVARLSVLERYGRGSKPANGYVEGFGEHFKGAIASSVAHDCHNLIVVGKESVDMRVALAKIIEMGGGFCVVKDRTVRASLPLPMGGLMSNQDSQEISASLKILEKISKNLGCVLAEPFLQLSFLSLPVIPSLKLTDRGLVDVNRFRIIDVLAN